MSEGARRQGERKPAPSLDVTVHDLGWDGRGVARLESGRVVFVRGALPGDRVIARVERDRRKAPLEATMETLLEGSADRQPHPCPHHSQGCPASPLGAWRAEAARAWKASHLEQTLRRVGKLESVEIHPTLASPQTWHYRDRIELTLAPGRDGRLRLGYRSGARIVPLRQCLLAAEAIAPVLQALAASLAKLAPLAGRIDPAARLLLRDNGQGAAIALLFTPSSAAGNDTLPLWRGWLAGAELAGWELRAAAEMDHRFFRSRRIDGEGSTGLLHPAPAGPIELPATAFTQANREAGQLLVHKALELLTPEASLLDLYGGWGPFGLAQAARGGSARVIEASEAAVQAGAGYASEHQIRCEFLRHDLGAGLPVSLEPGRFDAALLDPPRRGADEALLAALAEDGPSQLLYVSCHPAALARDLRALAPYRLVHATPVDLFPGSPDVEALVLLERR